MAKTKPKDIELADKADKNISDGVVTNNEVINEPEHISIVERLWRFLTFFTVEPCLICYVLPLVISSLTVQKINLEKACATDLGNPRDMCVDIIAGKIKNDTLWQNAEKQSQVLVANMTAWKSPIQSVVPAIIMLFIGAWSDRTGNRKVLIIGPIFGELVSAIGMLLTTYYFEWPLWVTGLIEAIPPAFCGSYTIALMGSYSYIADVTTVDSRTFRIGVLAITVTLGNAIGTALSGVLTESLGYYGIFTMNVCFCGFGVVFTYFRLKNVKDVPADGKSCTDKVIDFFHLRNAWETVSLLFLSPKKELVPIILVLCAHIFIAGPILGESGVLVLYMLYKYKFTIVEFSLFTFYNLLTGLAGSTVTIFLFTKLIKLDDGIIGAIATVSRVLASLMYALAPTKTWVYSCPALDFFASTAATIIRSLATKVVQSENIGKMSSLVGLVEALVPIVYAPIYSKLYAATLETLPGAFYILGAIMTTPAMFIFLFLYYKHKKEEKDVVKNPAEKEMHAHENAMTVL